MADYHTHLRASSGVGVVYGIGLWAGAGFSPVQGCLAAALTGLAGMLPDIDSGSGRPARELFGLLAAAVPLLAFERFAQFAGGSDAGLLLALLAYAAIRHGAPVILGFCSVHRGMFHSLPALLVASEITFLGYPAGGVALRTAMAIGVGLGFASHLLLDEVYSVQWNGTVVPALKSSAGTAFKVLGPTWWANVLAVGLASTLGYAVLLESPNFANAVANPYATTTSESTGVTPVAGTEPVGSSSATRSPRGVVAADWDEWSTRATRPLSNRAATSPPRPLPRTPGSAPTKTQPGKTQPGKSSSGKTSPSANPPDALPTAPRRP